MIDKATIKAYREYCNKTYGFVPAKDSGNGCKAKVGARKRPYGDYLYHQDRDMFMASLADEMKAGTFVRKVKCSVCQSTGRMVSSTGNPKHPLKIVPCEHCQKLT